jgi:hypothetical protein
VWEQIKLLAPKEKVVGLSWTHGLASVEEQPTPLAECTSHTHAMCNEMLVATSVKRKERSLMGR